MQGALSSRRASPACAPQSAYLQKHQAAGTPGSAESAPSSHPAHKQAALQCCLLALLLAEPCGVHSCLSLLVHRLLCCCCGDAVAE